MSRAVLAANLRALMDASADLRVQRQVAKRAGVDQRTVGRMLTQENGPNLDNISAVAEAFGLLAWQILVPGLDPKDPPATQLSRTERRVFERMREVATDFSHLSDH